MVAIRELLADLERLRARDPELRVFGARAHRYVLRPPASDEQLRASEALLGITYPEEYRRFMTEAGDGGAGPDHGLYPLATADNTNLAWLREHAPPDRPWPFDDEQTARQVKGKWDDHHFMIEEYAEGVELCGYVPLSEVGCGIDCVLVVTGEQRGKVWYKGDGVHPHFDLGDGRPLGFFRWYADWLAQALREATRLYG